MLYQGIIGGGSSPVEPENFSPVLLWTNSNVGASFAAQAVSLDLTEYAGVIVEFNRTSSSDAQTFANRSFIKKGETGLGGGNTVAVTPASRNVSCSNTGVTFEGGYSGTNPNDNAVIPTKIYGVKEYIVEPVGPITKELLWTNPSPTSDFGKYGETNYIDVDLTNYEYVLIEYYQNTANTATSFFMNKVSDLPLSTNGNQNGLGSSGSGYGMCRPVSKNSSNKLGFEGAFAGQTPALNSCIPIRVYGINGF